MKVKIAASVFWGIDEEGFTDERTSDKSFHFIVFSVRLGQCKLKAPCKRIIKSIVPLK